MSKLAGERRARPGHARHGAEPACVICLGDGPSERYGDALVTKVCDCVPPASAAAHMSCLENLVNAPALQRRPLQERLTCPVCKVPYHVQHALQLARQRSSMPPKNLLERIARTMTDNDRAAERLATRVAATVLFILLITAGVGLLVALIFAENRQALIFAGSLFIVLLLCVPLVRRRTRSREEEEARARSTAGMYMRVLLTVRAHAAAPAVEDVRPWRSLVQGAHSTSSLGPASSTDAHRVPGPAADAAPAVE